MSANILIVEDQSIIAWDLKSRLQNLGYEVPAIFASGEAAIEHVLATPPDLVLMDIQLKGALDGIETAAQIRAQVQVPIVYVTAHSDELTLRRANATDPYGYILKPFEEVEIRTSIEIALYKHRMDMQLRESERRFRAILEDVQLLAVTLDRGGGITFANDFLLQLTHWQNDEIIGRNWFDLFAPALDPSRDIFYATIDTGDLPAHWESELITRTGEQRIIAWSNTVLRDLQGGVSGIARLGHDITDRRRRERESEVIAALSAALRVVPSRAALFPVIVDFARDTLQPQGVALILCNTLTSDPAVVCATGLWTDQVGQLPATDWDVVRQIIATGQPCTSHDPNDLEQSEAVARLITGVPLAVEHETFGALLVARSVAQLPAAQCQVVNDRDLLSTIGKIAAIALYRTGVREALEQRVSDRTRELAEANHHLTELDHLKSKFIADVSHELRTPAANLKLYLSLLTDGKPEKRDQYIATLKEQAARLTDLIENVLDLSLLDDEEHRLATEPIDLNALTGDSVNSQQPNAERQEVTLTFEPALDLPRVHGLPNRLSQVITNLINNAINYTPEGTVRLRTRYDEQRDAAVLEVQDTGRGIGAEDLPHIFKRFYRGKHVGQSNRPGTGLGLAIVKEIIDQHGGGIEVESQVGQGSTFRVWLPIDLAAGQLGHRG